MVVGPSTAPRFRDRIVIVSGALGAIGLATAKRLAQEGAVLVLADLIDNLASDGVLSAIDECKQLGSPEVIAQPCDVSEEDHVDAVVDLTLQRFGRLDVMANVAGLMLFKSLEELTSQDWQRLLGVNLMGAVFFTRRALRVMPHGGAIVNVSSIHAIQTSALVAPYAAAKAAMVSLTRSTAIEGRAKGVRANAVLPGAVDTPMLWSNPNISSGVERIDPKYVGRPQDVATVIAFLASNEAAFISGSAFNVDGGRLATL